MYDIKIDTLHPANGDVVVVYIQNDDIGIDEALDYYQGIVKKLPQHTTVIACPSKHMCVDCLAKEDAIRWLKQILNVLMNEVVENG